AHPAVFVRMDFLARGPRHDRGLQPVYFGLRAVVAASRAPWHAHAAAHDPVVVAGLPFAAVLVVVAGRVVRFQDQEFEVARGVAVEVAAQRELAARLGRAVVAETFEPFAAGLDFLEPDARL